MVLKLKIFLFNFFQNLRILPLIVKNRIKNLRRTEKYIFLIGTPEYGNLGDQLIAVGELYWLESYYSDTPIVEYTHETLMQKFGCDLLFSQIRKQDILFLQGGGNLNGKYINCEKIRRRVLQKCPDNHIVLFQQSIHFEDTPDEMRYKEDTISIYNQHRHLLILTREDVSFAIAKEMFPSLRVEKFPDMATCLFSAVKPTATFQRDGIFLCTRSDNERYFSEEQWQQLLSYLKAYNVKHTDTHVGHAVPEYNRKKETQALIDSFAHAKVIITDRFHGVVFSVLSHTPCIALRSCDHKITEGVKWFCSYPGVLYADSVEEVPMLVEKAMKLDNVTTPDFSQYFERLYELIESEIS